MTEKQQVQKRIWNVLFENVLQPWTARGEFYGGGGGGGGVVSQSLEDQWVVQTGAKTLHCHHK